MKIAITIVRILLGLIFTVFGLNGFLHFIPAGPLPPGPAGEYMTALFESHYFLVIGVFQVAGGLLLLVNRFVPLGLTFLGPVVVNIILYHALLNSTGLPLALTVSVLWGILAFHYRRYFSSLFVQRAS